ncbi:MAG: hypothetical protein ABSG53_30445 [Thermoguttaceae bacterium]
MIITFAVIGISAIATTVLGAIAIRQIRRSNGRLYGLRLALLEALFYPALVVDCGVCGMLSVLILGLITTLWPHPAPLWAIEPLMIAFELILVVVADVLVYKWLRRKLKRPSGGTV